MARFKVLRQVEMTDCGPTCVQMLCWHHGRKHTLQKLKECISISRIGVTVRDVKSLCEKFGLEAVVAQSSSEQLSKAPLPLILHWRGIHFVVLYKIRTDKRGVRTYYLGDPAYGRMKFKEADFEKYWYGEDGKGVAIIARPKELFYTLPVEKEQKRDVVVRSLFSKIFRYRMRLVGAIACLLIATGCNWVIPMLYQQVIDRGVLAQNLPMVWQLFFAQLAFFVGYVVSNNLSTIMLMKLNFHVGIEYLADLLKKMIRLPIKYFDTRLSTDFIQRLNDYERLQDFLTNRLIELAFAVCNVVVFSVLLAYYNLTALALFFAVSIFAMLWNFMFLPERKFLDYSRFSEQARNRNILYEIVNGMHDIKVNNAQETQVGVWTENQQRINDLTLRGIIVNYRQEVGSSTINKLRDILIIALCAYLVVKQEMSLGVLMSVSYIMGQLAAPMSKLQYLAQGFQDAKISVARLNEIQQKEDEQAGKSNHFTFGTALSLNGVKFKYEGSFSPYIFENLTISFFKNKTTAIVGNSGSGKSTLIKLLLGFYYPQEGSVCIDGVPLLDIDINQWRAKCGVVLQDGHIFSGTIAENIALGDKKIDYRRVERCARLACIDDFICRLPGKYLMRIGSGGIDVSQGQKQRILIARAIYKNPELLIFDEATSSLDTVNERRIMDNLHSFFKERTVIVVAHRLSTVVNADSIIYLEDGRIAEQGTHRELVALHGKYYTLIKNQLEIDTN